MTSTACKLVDSDVLPQRCRECPSRSSGFCANLSAEHLAQLHPHLIRKRQAPGEKIIRQGIPNGHYYHVVAGTAKLSVVLPDGTEQILGLRFPGDFLGQRFARESGFTAEAATDIELCKVPSAALDRLADTITRVGHLMHRQVVAELEETRDWVLAIAQRNARQRVAGLIHRIARRQPCEGSPTRFALPLSRAEIANYLGLTVETISRQLTSLKRDGLIAIEGKTDVTVTDMVRLSTAAGIIA